MVVCVITRGMIPPRNGMVSDSHIEIRSVQGIDDDSSVVNQLAYLFIFPDVEAMKVTNLVISLTCT